MKIRVVLMAALLVTTPLCGRTPHRAPARVVVPYGDLDLTSGSGRATLDGRLATAARSVCRGIAVSTPIDWLEQRRCERGVLTRALASVSVATAAAQARVRLAEARTR